MVKRRLPNYFVSLQKTTPAEASAAAAVDGDDEAAENGNDISRCIAVQPQPLRAQTDAAGGCIKVNVKQLNLEYEHNAGDEITLVVGDAKNNEVLFFKERL